MRSGRGKLDPGTMAGPFPLRVIPPCAPVKSQQKLKKLLIGIISINSFRPPDAGLGISMK
jgi:hypothetical protein